MIVLQTESGLSLLSNWLKRFHAISNSIVLEVDVQNQRFISKAFHADKALVRRAEISFEEVNIFLDESLSEIPDSVEIINIGILLSLKQFMDILNSFSKVECRLNLEIDEDFCTRVTVESKSLTMAYNTFKLIEFSLVSDDTFNNVVYTVSENPFRVPLTHEVIKNIIAISDVYARDEKWDQLIFYTKLSESGIHELYVRDIPPSSGATMQQKSSGKKLNSYTCNFEYFISELDTSNLPNFEPLSISIFRNKFTLLYKDVPEDIIMVFDSNNPSPVRILFETADKKTKTAIGSKN